MSFVNEVHRIVDSFNDVTKNKSETPAGEEGNNNSDRWRKALPRLDGALEPYDKMESDAVPEKAWIGPSKESYRKDIDDILDAVIVVLESCGALDTRSSICTLRSAITESLQTIANHRELAISAPPESSLSLPYSMWTRSRESIEKSITAENQKVSAMRDQIERLRSEEHTSELQSRQYLVC